MMVHGFNTYSINGTVLSQRGIAHRKRWSPFKVNCIPIETILIATINESRILVNVFKFLQDSKKLTKTTALHSIDCGERR